MLTITDLSLQRGGVWLLEAVNLTIQPGQRVAIVGANGAGKSSLFQLLLGQLAPEQGSASLPGGCRIAHMAQEVAASSRSARDFVLDGDYDLRRMESELADAEEQGDDHRIARIHGELDIHEAWSAPRRAEALLRGLGFSDADADRPVSSFSGGWRIRLNLAQALMRPSDLLLLDEPTNHLDLDATLWLEQWLQAYPGTLLMISHDRDFIDATCERILSIEHQQLHTWKGNYSDYERLRAEMLANQQASFEKQQQRIAHIEDFVRRFRYKATKARQAQSRLKELERMQQLAPAHIDSPFNFMFPPAGKSSDPLLRIDEADLGYAGDPVLRNVNLVLRPGSRIGLLGKNGAGKSTLLKSLIGRLPLLRGARQAGEHCRIGYFDQQQLEALDLQASAALHLQRLSPEARDQDILNFLGGFNFRGDNATQPIAPFSGGEKARLALALVVWQRPNLLVLDEPTNHLDLDMRNAMEMALQGYEGALILVSHDRHLLRNTADELLLVHDGVVEAYEEDLRAYEKWILGSYRAGDNAAAASVATAPEASAKERRQQAAAQRERLRPLQREIAHTEKAMAQVEQALLALQARLADPEMYAGSSTGEVADLVKQEGVLKAEQSQLEERWLTQQEELEAITAPG